MGRKSVRAAPEKPGEALGFLMSTYRISLDEMKKGKRCHGCRKRLYPHTDWWIRTQGRALYQCYFCERGIQRDPHGHGEKLRQWRERQRAEGKFSIARSRKRR